MHGPVLLELGVRDTAVNKPDTGPWETDIELEVASFG